MTDISTFIEKLKADNLFEAVQTIKAILSDKARGVVADINVQVSEACGLKQSVKEEDETDDESDETDTESTGDEESSEETSKPEEDEEDEKSE